jgi:hypothetical protein
MAETANEAVQAQLAESNEAKEKIVAAAKERDRWRPTPTQEENDRAKLGEHVMEKQDDGSGPDSYAARAIEAGPGAGYQTRTMTPHERRR